MKSNHPPCWLASDEIGQLRVGASGLLIGRSADCDVVLPDPRTSRHHALVREGISGPLVIPLGRNPTLVNGARIEQVTPLQNCDLLQVSGINLEVVVNTSTRPSGRTWIAMRERGTVQAPIRRAMVVGGAEGDDLIVPGWPPSAARLDLTGRSLVATFQEPGRLDSEEHDRDEVVQVTSGSLLAFGDERLRLLMQRDQAEQTVLVQGADEDEPMTALRFTALPSKGARLELELDERTVAIDLPEHRARLMEGLVRAGGAWVMDEALVPVVYPPPQQRTSRDLELLLHRLRALLVREGIDPYRLVERRGSSTRLKCDPDTRLELR